MPHPPASAPRVSLETWLSERPVDNFAKLSLEDQGEVIHDPGVRDLALEEQVRIHEVYIEGLKKHITTLQTEEERPFNCSICKRSFANKSVLRRHGHIHSPPRFECSFPGCGAKFQTSRDRSRHESTIHSGSRRFKCNFPGCPGQPMSRRDNARNHIIQVHKVDAARANDMVIELPPDLDAPEEPDTQDMKSQGCSDGGPKLANAAPTAAVLADRTEDDDCQSNTPWHFINFDAANNSQSRSESTEVLSRDWIPPEIYVPMPSPKILDEPIDPAPFQMSAMPLDFTEPNVISWRYVQGPDEYIDEIFMNLGGQNLQGAPPPYPILFPHQGWEPTPPPSSDTPSSDTPQISQNQRSPQLQTSFPLPTLQSLRRNSSPITRGLGNSLESQLQISKSAGIPSNPAI